MQLISEQDFSSNLCPECNGNIITVQKKGETVCIKCGLIINERELDLSHSEIRAYNHLEKAKKERICPPISPFLPDLKYCTYIDKKHITYPALERAAKIDSQTPWKSRNILIATNELKRISHNLNLPDYIKKIAFHLYKKAFRMKLLKGRSIMGMVAACIYYACKNNNVPRTFKEILNESPINAKTIRKCYKTLIYKLNLIISNINPITLIPRFIADLGFNMDLEVASIKILKFFFQSASSCGKDPKGYCAAAIYLAAKLKNYRITQKQIANVVGVCEVTLRSRYKELSIPIFELI